MHSIKFWYIIRIKALVNSAKICIYHTCLSQKVCWDKLISLQKKKKSLIKGKCHLGKSFKGPIITKQVLGFIIMKVTVTFNFLMEDDKELNYNSGEFFKR